MFKTIEDVINKGLSVYFRSVAKRINGDWYIKIVWKVQWSESTVRSEGYIESAWEGFDTAEEAVIDLIETMNKLPMNEKMPIQ